MLNATAQRLEFFGGMNNNKFLRLKESEDYTYHASFKGHNGFQFGVGLDSVGFARKNWAFYLSFSQIGGSFYVQNGHHYQNNRETEGSTVKSLVSLNICPVQFTILRKMRFQFGVETSLKIVEGNTGTNLFSSGESGAYVKEPLSGVLLGKRVNFGLTMRVSYPFSINEKFTISPLYNFYFGNQEFSFIRLEGIHRLTHYFGLSLSKKIN